MIPEYIGPYRVLRSIASGGMAEVYEVQDPASDERLALKLLVAVTAALPRFDREYEAMTRLNHPSIVRVYHYGLHQGHPWLTMELLRGVPAQSHVRRVGQPGTPQRLREVLRMGYHVSKALHYIHGRKLVHRDIKSANVMVLPDDRVKLLDLGAAHLVDGQRITQEGEFVGTFAYASPEQIMAQRIDCRSDLYSLGVLLFRLATGRRPFHSRDTEELVRAHLMQPPPDPRTLVASLPAELSKVILALLAKDPNHRPPTAEHVAAELERIHGRPFTHRSRLAVHQTASSARQAEHRAMWEHLNDADASTLLVVHGDDGSDRVRFVDQLQADAPTHDFDPFLCTLRRIDPVRRLVDTLVAMGQASPHPERTVPIIDALRRCSTRAALAHANNRSVLRRAAAALARNACAEGRKVVLFVQEAHRADPASLELMGGLSRAMQNDPCHFRLVVSCRSAALEEAGFAHGLGSGRQLELTPLSPRQIAVAVGNMLGRRPPPAELARRLHGVTDGQPLYLEESVQVMVASGQIEAHGNRLAWADQATDVPPPEAALESAERALGRAPVAWRRVLEALALAEDANQPEVLARALAWSPSELDVVLRKLHEDGLVKLVRGDNDEQRVHWRHPMIRTLVTQRLHDCRVRVLRTRLAEATQEQLATRGAVAALCGIGQLERAAASAVSLVSELLRDHQVRTAVEVLEPIVESLTDQHRDPVFAHLLLSYASCLRRVRPTDPENGRTLTRLRKLIGEDGDEALLARADLAQARLYKAIGHYRNFRRYLDQAWAREPSQNDPKLNAPIATELARSHRWHGDIPKAERWVDKALVAAESSGNPSLFGDAVVQSAGCMLAQAHLSDAEQAYTVAMDHYRTAGDNPGYWRALARWAAVLRLQGRYSDALAQLYQRLPEASQSQDTAPYVELLQAAAWVELDLSRLGRAQEYTDELSATVGRGEHLHLRIETQLLKGRIQLASGQLQAAAYLLQEVQTKARNADLPVLAEQARAWLGETMFQIGDSRQARSIFSSAMLGLLACGDATVLADGVQSRARTYAALEDPDDIFRPVDRLIREEPMVLLRLEQLLARGAWHNAQGEVEASRQAYREAAMVLNVLATSLSDTERAALRVHPWSSRIRQGLREPN